MTDFQKAQEEVATAYAIMHPHGHGSDLSVLIDKLMEWAKTLNLDGYGRDALDAIYHFLTEYIIPWTMEFTPDNFDRALQLITYILKLLHDKYLPHPAPVV